MTGVDSAIWLTAGYAVLLILVAHGFDRLARVAARRSDRWRGGDFTYHQDHDAWVCSEDQWLWPMSFDPENRVTRYRAKPTVCNACPVKPACTTSDKGREMTRGHTRKPGAFIAGSPAPSWRWPGCFLW